MTMKLFFTCLTGLLCCGLASSLSAQNPTGELRGRVLETATGQPLPFATVYLNGSTLGTTADKDGNYRLAKLPLGNLDMVASFVGYKPHQQAIKLLKSDPLTLNFSLATQDVELQAVVVKGERDKVWQRQLRQFEDDMLGDTPFRNDCKITNPQVLSFGVNGTELTAKAGEPVQIENQALGYRLHYSLLSFRSQKGEMHYSGTVRFEPLTPTLAKQSERWRRNQQQAYEGSLRHFLTCLVQGNYEQNGFLAYTVEPRQLRRTAQIGLHAQIYRRLQPLTLSTLIQPGPLPSERTMVAATPMEVLYTKINSKASPYTDAPFAFTQLDLPQGKMVFTETGWVSQPLGMQLTGYLGQDRLSTLLPADWAPQTAADQSVVSTLLQEKSYRLPANARQDSLAKRYSANVLPPLVHVRSDRNLYLTGDKLRVSAWLVEPQTMTLWPRPAVMAVDLLDPNGRLVFHHWLAVTDGRATGSWRLPDSLRTGLYRLRAYTAADLTANRPAFERSLPVYNALNTSLPNSPVATDSVTLRALPEGGNWVGGLTSRVVIQTLDSQGQPLAAAGQLLDPQGNAIAQWQTNGGGAGSVVFTPTAGQVYRAVVSKRPHWPIILPEVNAQGITLSLDTADSTGAMLTLRGTNRQATAYVLVRSRGRVYQAFRGQLADGLLRERISYATMPAGLANVVVLNEVGQEMGQRLFFVPLRSQPPIVRVQRQPLHPDDAHLVMRLQLVPALSSSLVVLDSGQQGILSPGPSLRTQTLLTGWLAEPIAQAERYLSSKNGPDIQTLDALLIVQQAHKQSRIATELALDSVIAQPVWRGQLMDEKEQPLAGGNLSVMSLAPRQRFNRQLSLSATGWFELRNLPPSDSLDIWLQVQNSRRKPVAAKVRWQTADTWFAFTPAQDTLPNYVSIQATMAQARQQQVADTALILLRGEKQLNTVVVKGIKTVDKEAASVPKNIYSGADQILTRPVNAPHFANLYEMLAGSALVGVRCTRRDDGAGYDVMIGGVKSINNRINPLFIVDGVPIADPSGSALLGIDPGDVERIEVVRYGSAAIYGTRGSEGIIRFYSRKWTPEMAQPSEGRHWLVGVARPPGSGESDPKPEALLFRPLVLTGMGGTSSVRFLPATGYNPTYLLVEGMGLQGTAPISGIWRVEL